MVLLCIQPALRVVGELCERLLRCPVIFAEYLLPVLCECVTDLRRGFPADVLLHPPYIGLVYFMQLRDGLDPRPAYGIECPHGQVQICNIHLTNHVLSDKL